MAKVVQKLGYEGSGAAFGSVADEVVKVGGVEEEFIFEGVATQFGLAGGSSEYPAHGHWDAEPMNEQQFRSRFVLLRPADPTRFNGIVIAEWNNVSGGQDRFIGSLLASQLIHDGFAVAGVTTQYVGVHGVPNTGEVSEYFGTIVTNPPGLRDFDPDRYGTLEHPGDGFCYDIFTQATELLAPDRPNDLDPLAGLDVRHVVATGGSQSACRLATYINAVAPMTSAIDGYLLTVYAGNPCALDPATAPARLEETGDNRTVNILPFRRYTLREDLQVPVLILNSETEAGQCHPNTQADTDLIRWWEVAGTSHVGLLPAELLDSMFGDTGIAEALVLPGICRVSFAEMNRAALHALRHWMEDGEAPPHQPRLVKQGDPPSLPRDEYENAVGGIRWPEVEVPTATHIGESPTEGFVNLMGSSTPFPSEKIRSLYKDRQDWLNRYEQATQRLVDSRLLLADDGARIVARASMRELPF
jgi:hypothetical protein